MVIPKISPKVVFKKRPQVFIIFPPPVILTENFFPEKVIAQEERKSLSMNDPF